MSVLLVIFFLNLGALTIYKRLKMPPVLAYLSVLIGSVLCLWIGGMLNILLPTLIVIFSLISVLAVFNFFRTGAKQWLQDTKQYFDLPTALHNATGVVFTIIFAINKPMFYYWDEYSFWGIAGKIVKQANHIHSYGDATLEPFKALPSGSSLLSYLFNSFSFDFEPYKQYLSYAVLYFAVFAVFAYLIIKRFNKPYMGVLGYFALVLSPFTSVWHLPSPNYATNLYTYATSMVDFMLAVLVFAVVLAYFAKPDGYWYLLPTAFLVCIKDVGLLFAFVGVFVVSLFQLFVKKEETIKKGRLLKKLSVCLLGFLVPIIFYVGWSQIVYLPNHYEYANSNTQQDLIKNTDLKNTYQVPEITEPQQDVQNEQTVQLAYDNQQSNADIQTAFNVTTQADFQLLSEETENKPSFADDLLYNIKNKIIMVRDTLRRIFVPQYFTEGYANVLETMKTSFFNEKSTPFFKDPILVAGIILLGLLGIAFCDKKYRLAYIFTNLFLIVSAFLYVMFISVFISGFGDGMVEYGRYMSSYYYGWLYINFLLVLLALNKKHIAASVLLFIAAVLGVYSVYTVKLEHTVISAPQNAYVQNHEYMQKAEKYSDILTKDDRVYLVYDAVDIYKFMNYRYAFYPTVLSLDTNYTGIDFSNGFRVESEFTHDDKYYTLATKEQFALIMAQNFEYLYVDNTDKMFVQDYGTLFEGGVKNDTMYKIKDDNGKITFKVVE